MQENSFENRVKILNLTLFFCLTPLLLTENNSFALLGLVALLFFSVFSFNSPRKKIFWLLLVTVSAYLGSAPIFLLAATYLLLNVGLRISIIYLLTNICSLVVYQQWLLEFSNNNAALLSVSIGSAAFLMAQFFSMAILAIALKKILNISILTIGIILIWGLISILGYGGWLTTNVFTNELFRILPGLIFVALFLLNKTILEEKLSEKESTQQSAKYIVGAISTCLILMVAGVIFKQPINHIVFDEAHGEWETTKSSYGPDDFGRNITYTYSLLFEYSKKLTKQVSRYEGGDLPDKQDQTLFVVKMPIEPLSKDFILKIKDWVSKGGSLLVVGDHTNLFDTTTNLYPLLQTFNGIELASNANFNKIGNPTTVSGNTTDFIFGNVLGTSSPFNYMTGTSFKSIPLSAMVIGKYGQSYVEDAVYFRANRFGYFNPSMSMAYGNHASMINLSYGKGTVIVLGDSTPWSNFAIFRGEYFDLFKSIVNISKFSLLQPIYYYSLLGIIFSLLLLLFFSNSFTYILGVLAFTANISISALTGFASITYPEVGKDYHLNVMLGTGARAENLKQLVPIGENNFTRALSTFPKYGVIPRLNSNPKNVFNTTVPINLLINPDAKNLPNLTAIKKYLRGGGRVNILFDKSQVKDAQIQEWIKSLSMRLNAVKSLSIQEGDAKNLEDRLGIELSKVIQYKVEALQKSHFIEVEKSDFYQVFHLHENQSNMSNINGHLVIGFNSESISDAAIGEVWEGTIPSMLSKLREKQLAMLVTSDFSRPLASIDSQRKYFRKDLGTHLKKFIVVKDGLKLMSGDIEMLEAKGSVDSLGVNPDFYLAKLSKDAQNFINNDCEVLNSNGFCKENFISHDLVEWVVSYSRKNGKISAIELVHDQRFSGLMSTYNILFFEH